MYNVTELDRCKLLKPDGLKYSGTPSQSKVTAIKEAYELDMYDYNGHVYISTKIGLISQTTGDIMSETFERDVLRLGTKL